MDWKPFVPWPVWVVAIGCGFASLMLPEPWDNWPRLLFLCLAAVCCGGELGFALGTLKADLEAEDDDQ